MKKVFVQELNLLITLLKWFIFFIVFKKFVIFVIFIISDINTVKRLRQPKRTSLEKAFLLESEANIMTPDNWEYIFCESIFFTEKTFRFFYQNYLYFIFFEDIKLTSPLSKDWETTKCGHLFELFSLFPFLFLRFSFEIYFIR